MSERLGEKDVAEIRAFIAACYAEGIEDAYAVVHTAQALLADRDAHLADLKEARELIGWIRAMVQHGRDRRGRVIWLSERFTPHPDGRCECPVPPAIWHLEWGISDLLERTK